MASEKSEILQSTLDLMVLKTLATTTSAWDNSAFLAGRYRSGRGK